MSDFSSLGKGESLLANNKNNDSMACKKGGGDAAKAAGAAVAGVAVVGALAVGAAQSSLFSNGVGASGATQAGAASSISSASAGATSAASSAQSKAATAITQGPGAQSSATLDSAQGDLKSAQTDASQTAGQTRAGNDAKVAEAAAAVKNAQNYVNEAKSAVTQTPTWLAGKVASAFAAAPPAAAGLAKPSVGQLPTAPLSVNVPPPAKAVNASVPTPPSNLAIPPPANASTPTSTIKPSTTTQQTVQTEQLKQTALSKEETDPCQQKRRDLASKISEMRDYLENAGQAIYNLKNNPLNKSGKRPAGTLLMYIITTGVPASSKERGFVNTKYFTSSEPKELRDKVEFGPLTGFYNFYKALELAIQDIRYTLKCDELAPFEVLAQKRVDLLGAVDEISQACDKEINIQEMGEITRFLQLVLPAWEKINVIAFLLPDKYLEAENIKKGTSK